MCSYHMIMMIRIRKSLVTYFITLLGEISQNIIYCRVHTFLSQHSLQVRDCLLHQDLAISFLNITNSFGYCIITQLEIDKYLGLFIQLFSYLNLTWRFILHITYNPFLVRLITYTGPSSFSPRKNSGPLAISWMLWQKCLPWEATYSFMISRWQGKWILS